MWAKLELRDLDLGDPRLNERTVIMVDDFARCPAASVPEAAGSWAATKAAYRLWDNKRVDPDRIIAAHSRRTVERIPQTGPILVLQDTTSLDFTAHPATSGLGYLAGAKRSGLWVHSALCADSEGVPLGLLHQHVWVRDPAELGKRAQRAAKPTKEKESQRWLDTLAATERVLQPDRMVITVADREADFYDLFAAPRRPGSHLLIRAKPRRRVRHIERLLGDAVRATGARGTITVQVPRHGDRPTRNAKLTVRYARLAIVPPATHLRRKELPDLPLTAILVEEEHPPKGQAPVRWWLLTTLPIKSLADAKQAVRYYARRWLIERYHFALKSGCQIEKLQLETVDRLRRALSIYAIVAWRLLWLTYKAREEPDASCEGVLSADQRAVLERHPQVGSPAEDVHLTLREAVRRIARLGGFLARRGDGEPGVKVIWRGLRHLDDIVTGWRIASRGDPQLVGNG
jgi:Transposase DNA-binding/Transposase Tn5 dimerisation domain